MPTLWSRLSGSVAVTRSEDVDVDDADGRLPHDRLLRRTQQLVLHTAPAARAHGSVHPTQMTLPVVRVQPTWILASRFSSSCSRFSTLAFSCHITRAASQPRKTQPGPRMSYYAASGPRHPHVSSGMTASCRLLCLPACPRTCFSVKVMDSSFLLRRCSSICCCSRARAFFALSICTPHPAPSEEASAAAQSQQPYPPSCRPAVPAVSPPSCAAPAASSHSPRPAPPPPAPPHEH